MRILCLSLFWCFCRITVFLSASELSTLYGEAESFGQFLDCFIQPLQGESGLPLPFEERISRQLLDIVEESPAQLRSVSPSQLSSYLHKASQSYLEVGAIPEFHAMQTLSFYTRKLHNTQTPEIVLELIELLRIKRLAWKIRQQLHSICRGSHLSTYLALKEEIEKIHCSWLLQKTKWACTFFYDFAEKNSLQQIKQTIGTLYMAQLQEVLHAAWDLQMQAKKQRGEPIAILEGKKILIFTCSYGTGHRMTAAATEQMLSREGAEVVVHDLSVGALLGQDTWRMIFKTLGIYHENRPLNSVDIFNLILKNQYYFLVNTQNKIDLFFRGILNIPGKHGVASPSSLLENSWAKTQLRDLVFLEKPDQIITSYHMDLNPILEIAEEFGIPVLHIPTDYDMKFWEVFDDTPSTYAHFKTLVPNYQVVQTRETLEPLSQIHAIEKVGIPLRLSFYERLEGGEVKEFKKKLKVQPEEKVLLVSSGGNGQNLPHPILLAHSTTWKIPLRIEVLAGKNRDFVKALQGALEAIDGDDHLLRGANPFVTVHILVNEKAKHSDAEDMYFIGADVLSRVLDIADACVAKAGGLSVAELMFKGVPVVFDRRLTPFIWEQFNIDTVVQEGMGVENRDIKTFEKDLQFILALPPKREREQFHFPHAQKLLVRAVHKQMEQALVHEMREMAKADLVSMNEAELDANWKLNDYFGHIKVISSNPSASRFQRCQKEMAQIGLHTYEISPGVNGALLEPSLWQRADNWDPNDTDWQKQGRMGCLMAHYEAILDSAIQWEEACRQKEELQISDTPDAGSLAAVEQQIRKYSSLLIIEDNTGFGRVTGEHTATLEGCGRRWRQVVMGLPVNWDMLYLVTMADNWGPSVQISKELVRLRYGVLTKCYAIRAPFYRVVLDHFEKKLYDSYGKIAPIDHVLAELQRYHRCYAPLGIGLAYRFGSTSEVQSSPGVVRNWQPAVTKLDDPL